MPGLEDVRRLILALPGTIEVAHSGAPGFKAGGKLFAVLRQPDRASLKFDPEDQHNLIEGYPGVVEPLGGKGTRISNAGRAGWTFVNYAVGDEAFIAGLLRLAWSGAEAARPTRRRAR